MNRTLFQVLKGRAVAAAPVGEADAAEPNVAAEENAAETCEQDPAVVLAQAQSIVIVPGYGMALAQAQQQVRALFNKLEEKGKDVTFAIHAVAGRMPGHMNVLLAEVGIPYDKLRQMDDFGDGFGGVDVVIVVGANDVVNAAAETAEGTPIYGMPIFHVEQAGRVIVCNKDTEPGYAGVDNELYQQHNAILVLGDAAETIKKLSDQLT